MKDLRKAAVTWVDVGDDAEAQRIDNFLMRTLRGVPKSHVYRMLRNGEVRVNSARVAPSHRLHAGDRVRVPPVRTAEAPAAPHLPAQLQLPVVYEDAALLVIDKPTGIAVHGGSGLRYGVIEAMRLLRPDERFLELVHRLDRDTSGLLMLARKRTALVELHRMLRDGEVQKVYLAMVKGHWRRGSAEISKPLQKSVTRSGERRVSVDARGAPAATRVKPVYAGDAFSVLELRLLTGRTHQIRVHLADEGHPILGDDKYGDFALNRQFARVGIRRLMLHAQRLVLRHPLSGETLRLESSPPPEMSDPRRLLEAMKQHA